MFNLQGSEIIIVLLLALVVLGPEKLPDAMRKLGQAYAELKKMSSGFQNEFRAAVDEPMREMRETADAIRDSADFTKLQSGERDEKPKSAEMAPVDPDAVPTDDLPTFDTDTTDPEGPTTAAGSAPAPFEDEPDIVEAAAPSPTSASPQWEPFTGMSAEPDDGNPADDVSGEPDAPVAPDDTPAGSSETSGDDSGRDTAR